MSSAKTKCVGKCVVPQCENLGEHFFPKDESQRQKWIKQLALDKITLVRPIKKYSRICSAHFVPSDYDITNKRVTLKRTAIPSVFRQDTKKAKPNYLKVKSYAKTYARKVMRIAYVEEFLYPVLKIETPSESDPDDDDKEKLTKNTAS